MHPLSYHLGFTEKGVPYTDLKLYSRSNVTLPYFREMKRNRTIHGNTTQRRWKLPLPVNLWWLHTNDLKQPNPQLAAYAAEAYYGMLRPYWAEVCHENGDPLDNSMDNLTMKCAINNAIDEVVLGRKQSCIDQLNIAIARLQELKEKYETAN